MEFWTSLDWQPLWLTFKLASVTTFFLLLIGLPLAYFLAFSKFKGKALINTLVTLPMVLPPTVIGFYFLLLFTPSKGLGKFLNNTFDIQLVFSFSGLVLASIIYSLPFMIQPLQNGFSSVPKNIVEAAYVLGKSKRITFYKVILPNAKSALITACVLSFAHTVGEFGVVLMVGGSIPGKTKVAASAIYEYVEALAYGTAHIYAGILLGFSFLMLLLVNLYAQKNAKLFY